MIDALLAWLKTCEPKARWRGEDLASWTSFSIQRDVHHGEGLARLAAMPLTRLQISGDYRAEELAPLAALGATVEQLRLHVPTLDDFTPFAGWERLHTLDVPTGWS